MSCSIKGAAAYPAPPIFQKPLLSRAQRNLVKRDREGMDWLCTSNFCPSQAFDVAICCVPRQKMGEANRKIVSQAGRPIKAL